MIAGCDPQNGTSVRYMVLVVKYGVCHTSHVYGSSLCSPSTKLLYRCKYCTYFRGSLSQHQPELDQQKVSMAAIDRDMKGRSSFSRRPDVSHSLKQGYHNILAKMSYLSTERRTLRGMKHLVHICSSKLERNVSGTQMCLHTQTPPIISDRCGNWTDKGTTNLCGYDTGFPTSGAEVQYLVPSGAQQHNCRPTVL